MADELEKTCENCKYEFESYEGEHCRHCIHSAEEHFEPKIIVPTEAEIYNNGWIPCSERLPEGNKAVLVCTNAGQIDVDYYGEYIKDFIGLKGTEQHAIAWQPLPAPFKKAGAV